MPTGNEFYNNVMDNNFYGALETHANLGVARSASKWVNNIFSNNKVVFMCRKDLHCLRKVIIYFMEISMTIIYG